MSLQQEIKEMRIAWIKDLIATLKAGELHLLKGKLDAALVIEEESLESLKSNG